MMERNGQQLGNYRLVKRLGRGGAAEVYLGEHIFLNTQAALKLLQAPQPEQDTPGFLREARTIAALAHPHIVRVLDFGVQDETFYLVMEYASRGTLRQRYPPGTRLGQATVVELIKQIASALQYAHDQNIIHCDVKPENVLLGKDDTLLLSDFGISMVLQTMTAQEMQHIAGTIAYMAPEQFDGKPQRASDQYALAVITYEWLSGERPFQGSVAAISSQHLHGQVAPLSHKVPGISPAVDDVLSVAMEKDPARRFGSIQAFARALEQACADPHVQTRFAEEGPTWQATITPAPVPLLTPHELERPAHLDVTVASAHMRAIQPDTDPRAFSGPPYALPVQTDESGQLRRGSARAGQGLSRRAFLAGVGGAVIVGGALTLLLSSKLSALFTPAPVATTSVPEKHATPRVTAQSVSTSTISTTSTTTTSNIPLGATLITYGGQSGAVTSVCWSPVLSSRLVASCSEDKSVAIWNATTGTSVRTFSQGAALSVVVWSPDGQYLAFAGDDKNVEVRSALTGSLIALCTGHSQPVRGLAWSPDSRRLVSTSEDRTAIVWDALNGNRQQVYTRHSDFVWAAAWAPNGHAIATASWDRTVQLWNPANGALLLSYSASQPVRAVDWSPDSNLLASGGDEDAVQVWQASNGQVQAVYRGHNDHIETVQWAPNGQRVASSSKDGTAQIWQASNANPFYTYRGHSTIVWSLAWSPDGQFIASASGDATTRVWQAT
ncbi:MAG TPA: serine/threonine-protein kinase [Ktedonobacteraceae bacterium]